MIDVMVGVSQLAEAEGRIGALEGAGYEYVQKYEIELPERRYFRKPRLGPSAYHLHCVVKEVVSGFATSRFGIIFVLIRNPPRPTAS